MSDNTNSNERDIVDSFRSNFLDFHKQLKIKIFKCQLKWYENKKLGSSALQTELSKWFLPMLILRDDAKNIMQDTMAEYYKWIEKAKKENNNFKSWDNQLNITLNTKHDNFKKIYEKGL